jgi:hypothetical protein
VLLGVGQHAGERAGEDGFFHHVSVVVFKFDLDQQGAGFDLVAGLGMHALTRPAACADSHISIFMASTQTSAGLQCHRVAHGHLAPGSPCPRRATARAGVLGRIAVRECGDFAEHVHAARHREVQLATRAIRPRR